MDLHTASREELIAFATSVQAQNKQLAARVAWFERQIFGVKSEKLIPQDPRQATLFAAIEEPPPANTSVKSYERKARKNPTDATDDGVCVRFSDSVPVDEEIVYPKEVEGLEEGAYEVIGEKVTERLMQTPTQYRVKRSIRKTVKLKSSQSLHTAPAPGAVIERSFADATLLAGLITDKFLFHLPLYRQHQRMLQAGVQVSRPHLTKLVHRSLELLEPVYQAIVSMVCTSELVAMDETPVRAGRREKGKMKTAYFWPVCAGAQIAFIYSSSRGQKVIADVLSKGCKKLLSDGYVAYERYAANREALVHAQCWAHVRRKFFDAKEHAPDECERVLALIGKLFEIEQKVRDADEVEVAVARRCESAPLVDELFGYLELLWIEQMVDRTSLLGKAVHYARAREDGLKQFLAHPDIPLSNNHVERSIRPVALGRKNWMFCWSEVGAKYTAIAYTLIECCKMQGIDPWRYLVDVLQRIDDHRADDVHLLTPRYWKDHFQVERKDAA